MLKVLFASYPTFAFPLTTSLPMLSLLVRAMVVEELFRSEPTKSSNLNSSRPLRPCSRSSWIRYATKGDITRVSSPELFIPVNLLLASFLAAGEWPALLPRH